MTSDNELIDRLQKGDIEAFDQIYDRYSLKLYSFGLKYLRSDDEAEELVQSVFLKIWENYKFLKKESSFKSYIFTIAYNEICKLFRKRHYQKKYIDNSLINNSLNTLEIEDGINHQTILNLVQKIVDKLPEKQKIIFVKSRIEGKATKEIAEELGLSPGTVDNYISEILKLIRNSLRKENFVIALFFSIFYM